MNIEEFTKASRRRTWTDATNAFSIDVDAAADWEKQLFRLTSAPYNDNETEELRFELEWIGEGTALADIDRDFYRLYGRVAEECQFISRSVTSGAVVYEVLVGTAAHGHYAVFHITGARVRAVVESYLKLRSERQTR